MKEIEWAIEILAVLDVCINMYCFIYVIKTFNTKNCINYIMCIDSIMSAISSLVVIFFYAVGLKNSWTCTTVTIALLMVPTMMVVYHFIKAYIRYKRVSTSLNHETWKTEKELIQDTNKALSLTAVLLLIIVITNAIFDIRWNHIYNHCTGVTNNSRAWMGLLVHLVRVLIIIGTIHLDIKCLKLVQRIRNNPNPAASHQSDQGTQEQRHMLHEIPMRSTILNFGLILNFFVILTVASKTGEGLYSATFGVLVMLLFKSPVSVFWTVRVNETNARIDKDKERERRRQLEVQEALKKREQRRRLQSMVQMQPVELQDLEENQEQGRISD